LSAAGPSPPRPRRPFVLVHGGFHGGWCWRKVRPLLARAGHEVFTPSLTGLGDRAHLLSPAVDLETHLTDVTALLESEDLRQVVLVGHSYGGIVVTGAADRVPDRIALLVLVDSPTPVAGRSYLDLVPGLEPWVKSEGWSLPPFGPEAFGVTDPRDVAFMAARLRPQPAATLQQPLALGGRYAALPRAYIAASESGPDEAVRSQAAGWEVRVLRGPHDLMMVSPGPLARELLALAQR
jgi:pimeloyl-ACP methyl ester carboxylesterase